MCSGCSPATTAASLDQVVSRIVDIWMAFPPVLFSILLVAVLGTGLHSVIIAIVAIDWIRFCRVVRGETLSQSRMDYVDSARVAGFSRFAILVKEVLPNCCRPSSCCCRSRWESPSSSRRSSPS